MAKNAIRAFSSAVSKTRMPLRSSIKWTTSTPGTGADSLYRRLSPLGGKSDATISETLDKWVAEGKPFHKFDVVGCANQLRRYKRFKHALLIFEWMEKKGVEFTFSDHAIRLDLHSKTYGIASAENYFTGLSEPAKNKYTCGALLNCYCKDKMVEKATELFEKMKEQNVAFTPLAYNNMMTLYTKVGQPEKVRQLYEEMKERGISPNSFAYSIIMQHYASLKDIEGVERVMKELKGREKGVLQWSNYSCLAGIYIAEGLFDKAYSTLKELELVNCLRNRDVFHHLISLYAGTGNLEQVHRVWNSLKSVFPNLTNMCYLTMIYALSKLDDFEGLRKCYEEWESGCSSYDVRLMYPILSAYLKRGMIEEAESLYENALKKGFIPSFRTLEMLMDFGLNNQMIEMGLKYMDVAVNMVKKNEWSLSQERVRAFMKYFEEEKDVAGAEEFYKKLKRVNSVVIEVYESLLRTYIVAGRTDAHIRQRMEEDMVEVNDKTKKLLESVCI